MYITIKSPKAIGRANLEKKPYLRLLLHGGARSSSDNSAFYFASLNVIKDYGNSGKIIRKSIDTARQIIDIINEQENDSIQSLDIFAHGGPGGIFLIKGASVNTDIAKDDVEENNLNSSLYVGEIVKSFYGSDKNDDSRTVKKINFSKFTVNSKIELHGCQTCYDMLILDNICEELSELLYQAGKTESVVIGHKDKANPNINGDGPMTNSQQDYRHGTRCLFNNGNAILTTTKKGRITASEINDALQKRK